LKNKFKGRNNAEVVKSSTTTAIILSDRKSSRMGSDKCLLPINGTTMIEHIIRHLLNIVETRFIDFGKEGWYENLNQKADYQEFLNKRKNGLNGRQI